jgi:hypothetical protein
VNKTDGRAPMPNDDNIVPFRPRAALSLPEYVMTNGSFTSRKKSARDNSRTSTRVRFKLVGSHPGKSRLRVGLSSVACRFSFIT